MNRVPRVLLVIVVLVTGLVFGATAPGEAHRAHNLKGRIVSQFAEDCAAHARRCAWVGDVLVVNNRAPGTGPLRICVGIDVYTDSHNNLSSGTSLHGQAMVTLRPGHRVTAEYRAVYKVAHSRAVKVQVHHLHPAGTPC